VFFERLANQFHIRRIILNQQDLPEWLH
jgi:hypothetical protein